MKKNWNLIDLIAAYLGLIVVTYLAGPQPVDHLVGLLIGMVILELLYRALTGLYAYLTS